MPKTPKLPLTDRERAVLRMNKITIKEIAGLNPEDLSSMMQIHKQRAKELVALAEFQQIPSIGPVIAQGVVDLGYYSLKDLKGIDGVKLLDDLETMNGYWEDPCVEDAMRLISHYAEHGDTGKQWFDFTEERKRYRKQYGYPATRPITPWHEAKVKNR